MGKMKKDITNLHTPFIAFKLCKQPLFSHTVKLSDTNEDETNEGG